jgi:succinate dehydrogenase / fumarate reductase membrane anchor subunit
MRNLGVQSRGAIHWLLQRVTGIALVFFLVLHTVMSHLTLPPEGITYEWVAGRLANPYWKLLYLFFLILLVYHGLNGVWTIFQDYVHRDGLRLSLLGFLMMLGLFMLSLGALTIIPFTVRS